MPNCSVCQRRLYRTMQTAGKANEAVCSPECAAVVEDEEAAAQDLANEAARDAERDYNESRGV